MLAQALAMTVVNFPEQEGPPDIRGPERGGRDVLIEGRIVPRLHMYEYPSYVEFILDGRLSYTFPKEIAHHAAHFAATAMAIGAGYSFFHGTTTDRPFAPECHRIEFGE